MRLLEFTSRVDELHVDNYKGLGATPNNANVDYKGINVSMYSLRPKIHGAIGVFFFLSNKSIIKIKNGCISKCSWPTPMINNVAYL
jgi:hypothetical protein